ncbi:hypothetical protein ADL15_44725 [Actinoplanes awajinensis subsp. mycoplanecinus]|uniref:HTH tetR-type domain-containing protein n=1 Tax=Actinoplanes awajinensis subsp. mycoplanecinus TaxID=135947 RepID=A0A101JBW7_9ACTN|nr:hypothetical protein ADL15_44725 [Actinoplanes awajinensis subsp. mycoplanecinus]
MSELRARRADAERSRAAVRQAAIDLLAERPQASMRDIATAAGVARQTVYAHYPTREELIAAVIGHIAADVTSQVDRLDPEKGLPTETLGHWLDLLWEILTKYPILHTDALNGAPEVDPQRHAPITDRLTRLIERGQAAGEFDARVPPAWLGAAVIGLIHVAAAEVAAGRLSATDARRAFHTSALHLCRPDR